MTEQPMPAERGTVRPYSSESSRKSFPRNDYIYPQIPLPQHPVPAHMPYGKRASEGQTTDTTKIGGSVSSTSGSSDILRQKQFKQQSSSMHWPPATQHYETHLTATAPSWRHDSPARSAHAHKKSEMTQHTSSPALEYVRERRRLEEEDDMDSNVEEEDHALWVLFWLSCLDPIHCLAGAVFTLFVLFGLALGLPIRVFHKQNSFGDQLIRTLAPFFKHHLEMMYGQSTERAFEWDFRPSMLVLMQIIAPLFSIGVAIASWVTAAFWVFTSIMGNPDGTERRDDGRDAVLAVRNWWERVMLLAIRPLVRRSGRSVV